MEIIIVSLSAVALIVLLGMIFQGRINAIKRENAELLDVIEDKDKRIENLIKFKPSCETFKVSKIKGGKYQLHVYKDGKPWESYPESGAQETLDFIVNLR